MLLRTLTGGQATPSRSRIGPSTPPGRVPARRWHRAPPPATRRSHDVLRRRRRLAYPGRVRLGDLPPQLASAKPRLRGWLHLWSFAVGIAAGTTLVTLAAATVSAAAAAACAVYAVAVLGLFGISALYHRRAWTSVRARTTMKRLDHAMIFIF